MRFLKQIAALGLTAGLGAGAALAEGVDGKGPAQILDQMPKSTKAAPWSGFYLGVHGGKGWGDVEVSAGSFGIDGFSAEGWVGGVHGGVDVQVPGGPLVVRGRCAYTWGSVEFNVNPGIFSASIEDGWSCDAGLGYAMNSALPYVFAGYTKAKTAASIYGNSLNSPDLEGMRYGGGVEWRTSLANVTLGVDYTFTDYKDLNFGPLTVDPDDHRVMLRLNLRMGPQATQ